MGDDSAAHVGARVPRADDQETRFVPRMVAERAAAAPEAIAVMAGDRVLTYRDLDARANQLAHHLRALGVDAEVVVGLCLHRSADFVVSALAVMKAGGAYLPLDPTAPPERLRFMLADADVPVVITRQGIAADLQSGPWHTLVLDRDEAEIDAHPLHAPDSTPRPDALAYVIYTSGSTGQPKGVEIAHRNLMHLVRWHRQAFAITPSDRASQIASVAFDAAVWEVWPYLTAGASVYIPGEQTRLSPSLLRDWLLANAITICFLPTPLAEIAITLEWPSGGSLRAMLTGGDMLHSYPSPTLPFALINNYGPAENTVVATSGIVPPGDAYITPPSIGRPITGVQVYILDAARQPVPVGAEGEIYLGGASVARGYRGRPEMTAASFLPDPFNPAPGARLYRTGDRAREREDGSIEFAGRADEQVKIRGYRIELGEIATVLQQAPAVRHGHVAVQEDAVGAPQLVAYIVPAPGANPTASDLRAFLGARLPGYMIPAVFVQIASLPITTNGKVDRAVLPPPDETNRLRDERIVAPRTQTETQLAEIVAALLGLDQVGIDDDFFLLGGHSLLGIQLISRIRDRFGVELPLLTVFEAPTVTELAAEIERRIVADLEMLSDDEVQRLLT